MIWCDAQKKGDCRISLSGFWLYLPHALLYRQLLFETSLSFCWNLVLQKECIKFYLNSFSSHFHCNILSLFFYSAYIFNCSRLLGVPLNKSWTDYVHTVIKHTLEPKYPFNTIYTKAKKFINAKQWVM